MSSCKKCRHPCSFLSNTELKPSLCNVEPPVYDLGDYQFLEAEFKSFCWFHRRFGPHAQKCRDPCSFLSNSELKPSLCNVEPPVYNLGDYQFLEAEFPEVFSVSNLKFPPKHDIIHYIETTVPSIKQRPRRLSPEKLAVLRKELSQLE